MTRDDLIAEAVRNYDFRPRRADEPADAYLTALIAHVHTRDFSAAEELRLGKRQADWSEAEAQGFYKRLQQPPAADVHDPDRGFAPTMMIQTGERRAVTDESLVASGRDALAYAKDFRTKKPRKDFHIMTSVLLTDGRFLTATPSREDRIRVLKALVRTMPVYGYVTVADVFVHSFTKDPATGVMSKATKEDAIIVHMGSRSMRRVFTLRYRVTHWDVQWEPLIELDSTQTAEDPYAEVFVSVPMPTGKPS